MTSQWGAVEQRVVSSTAQLLWAAARPEPDVEAINRALAEGADTDRAATAAIVNRVGPLFWRAVHMAGVAERLDTAAVALEHEHKLRHAQAHIVLPIALVRIVEPLRAAGLQPLIFKGPSVAARYPDPGLRPMDDVDVILPSAAFRTGIDALTRGGWKDVRHSRTAVRRAKDDYDTVLVHPDIPQLPLELHWDVASWHERSTNVRAMTLWRSRQPVELFGIDTFCLPAEEDVVALANHAGKPFHAFDRLMWSVDIAIVIGATRGGLDWDRVAWLAHRWQCRTVLAVALRQARRLGADVPDALTALPAAPHRRASIAAVLDEEWPFTGYDEATAYELRHALADSAIRRAQLFAGELVFGAPTHEIPGRAVRLAGRLMRRWWRRRTAR
jgi:hypothetical protein